MAKSEVVVSDINRNKPKFIDQDDLVSLIKGANSIDSYHPHLHAFYSECSENLIIKFVEENDLTAKELVTGYEEGVKPFLPATDQKENWLYSLLD